MNVTASAAVVVLGAALPGLGPVGAASAAYGSGPGPIVLHRSAEVVPSRTAKGSTITLRRSGLVVPRSPAGGGGVLPPAGARPSRAFDEGGLGAAAVVALALGAVLVAVAAAYAGARVDRRRPPGPLRPG